MVCFTACVVVWMCGVLESMQCCCVAQRFALTAAGYCTVFTWCTCRLGSILLVCRFLAAAAVHCCAHRSLQSGCKLFTPRYACLRQSCAWHANTINSRKCFSEIYCHNSIRYAACCRRLSTGCTCELLLLHIVHYTYTCSSLNSSPR